MAHFPSRCACSVPAAMPRSVASQPATLGATSGSGDTGIGLAAGYSRTVQALPELGQQPQIRPGARPADGRNRPTLSKHLCFKLPQQHNLLCITLHAAKAPCCLQALQSWQVDQLLALFRAAAPGEEDADMPEEVVQASGGLTRRKRGPVREEVEEGNLNVMQAPEKRRRVTTKKACEAQRSPTRCSTALQAKGATAVADAAQETIRALRAARLQPLSVSVRTICPGPCDSLLNGRRACAPGSHSPPLGHLGVTPLRIPEGW